VLKNFNLSLVLAGVMGGAFAAPSAGVIPINTIQDLEHINSNLAGHYVLMKNLNLTGVKFMPIGSAQNQFTGYFDGGGHTLSNLTINVSKTNATGLFASVGEGAVIENLNLSNANVTGWVSTGILTGVNAGAINHVRISGNVTGDINTGGLVGANNVGKISYCSANVSVTANGNFAGGLVGGNSEGTIDHSFAIATVEDPNGNHVGGLVGDNYNGVISQSYAEGAVSGIDDVGGLSGGNDMGELSNAFANVSVNATGDFVGGLTGDNIESGNISNAYSLGHVSGGGIVGGLVGYSEGGVINAYWDLDTSGQEKSGGGVGESDLAMQNQNTYENWDFKTVWQMQKYPLLRN